MTAVTHQHHQPSAALSQLLQRINAIVRNGHSKPPAHVYFFLSRTLTRLHLRLLDLSQTPLLLRQRCLKLRMRIVLLEALGRQLFRGRSEDRLPKVFRAQLAYER
jgi:hypothetical protein